MFVSRVRRRPLSMDRSSSVSSLVHGSFRRKQLRWPIEHRSRRRVTDSASRRQIGFSSSEGYATFVSKAHDPFLSRSEGKPLANRDDWIVASRHSPPQVQAWLDCKQSRARSNVEWSLVRYLGDLDRDLDRTPAGRNPRRNRGRPVVIEEFQRPRPYYCGDLQDAIRRERLRKNPLRQLQRTSRF